MKHNLIIAFFKVRAIAAGNLFQSIRNAGVSLKDNMGIIAPILFVCSVCAGALMFNFGRKGAEHGKGHVWNVMMGVVIFCVAASLIATLFSIFGGNAQGI